MYKNVSKPYTLVLILLFSSYFFVKSASAQSFLPHQQPVAADLHDNNGIITLSVLQSITSGKNQTNISDKSRLSYSQQSRELPLLIPLVHVGATNWAAGAIENQISISCHTTRFNRIAVITNIIDKINSRS